MLTDTVKNGKMRLVATILMTMLVAFLTLYGASSTHAQTNGSIELVYHLGNLQTIFTDGSIAYVGEANRMVVLDVSDAENIIEVGNVDGLPYGIDKIIVSDDVAYTISKDKFVMIIDVSDSQQPVLLGSYEIEEEESEFITRDVSEIVIIGEYLYVGTKDWGLIILDVSDPSNPVEQRKYHELEGLRQTKRVFVVGNIAYLLIGWDPSLHLLDVSDPANPELIEIREFSQYSYDDIYVTEDRLYVLGYFSLTVLDNSDPSNPTSLYYHKFDDTAIPLHSDILHVEGDEVYLTNNSDRLVYVDITNPSETTYLHGFSQQDAQVVDGKVYVIYDSFYQNQHELSIIDISNPTRTTLGTYDHDNLTGINDIQLESNVGYVATIAGLSILDTSDSLKPVPLSFYPIEQAENVHVVGTVAYVAAGQNGMSIVDVSDPANPTLLGTYNDSQLTHVADVQVVNDVAYIIDSDNTLGLWVVDVSDLTNLNRIGSYNHEFPYALQVVDDVAYVVSTSPIKTEFGISYESDIAILDVSDPTQPSLFSNYHHDEMIKDIWVADSLIYISDTYNLGVVDVSDPLTPVVIGDAYDNSDYVDGELQRINEDIHVDDGVVYTLRPPVFSQRSEVEVIDFSDVTNPAEVAQYHRFTYEEEWITGNTINVSGNAIYVGGSIGLFVLKQIPSTSMFQCTAVNEIPQSECEALVALYRSTGADSWNESAKVDWLITDTPCSWVGITCENGHVTRININDAGLSGAIPTEIGNLTALTHLGFANNRITELPPEIGNLTNLLYFGVTGNPQLPLPSEIETLPNLIGLYLYENQYTTLPLNIGNMTSLEELHLWGNELTALSPEIGSISNLRELILRENQFSELPNELTNLINLTRLDVRYNPTLIALPDGISDMPNLAQIQTDGTQIACATAECTNVPLAVGYSQYSIISQGSVILILSAVFTLTFITFGVKRG